ncbi:MAG TPA: NAD(P)-dependent oxidoreductase [Candidatus Binataceae bacterium]|nr:NAD(P)-dependent oxidoreductase [Candidatus Binataceae bacterium]
MAEKKYRVLITEPVGGDAGANMESALRDAGCEIVLGRPFTDAASIYSEDELKSMVREMDALLVSSRELFTRAVMMAGPRLVTIAKLGIGVERIDVKAATELGIVVSNTPIPENYLAVAEYAVAFMLAMAKQLKPGDQQGRAGRWRSIVGTFMRGKTVGLVGFGRIGSRVASLLTPFEVRLLTFDPFVKPERAAQAGVELVSLDRLMSESDFVSLHAVVTAENRNLIGAHELALMKPTAYLINTARGALIDETALAAVLKAGRIAGAALDVFEPEPPPPSSPLLSDELATRVLITPHVAGMSPELIAKMPMVQTENCIRALRGERPEYVANPDVMPRWRGLKPAAR